MSFKDRILEFENNNNRFRYLIELLTLQVGQYEYENLPDTILPEYLELFLTINGTAVIGKPKNSDDLYCALGSYCGNIMGYLPSEYQGVVTNIGTIRGNWFGENKTVVVGCNNNRRSPDFDIPHTADILTQVDISEKCNVLFSRFARLPYADNDKQKAQIESAVQSILKGDCFAVANRDISTAIDDFFNNVKPKDNDKFLDLVDVDKINCLQYLNQYRDNIFKRYLMRRGYMMQTTSKLAQQTRSELHGSDSYALLYPLEQFEKRKKMIKECNDLFNTNITVKMNPILQKVYDNFLKDDEQKENVPRETFSEGSENNENNSSSENNPGSDIES